MAEISPISQPLADKKKEKKIFKAVGKAKTERGVCRGVKASHRMLRKQKKGIIILAGNTSPIDIISHFPAFCQEKKLPWVFVEDSLELGKAYGTRVPIICLMIIEPEKGAGYEKIFRKLEKMVNKMDKKVEKFE